MPEYVYLDGNLIESEKACISIHDAGLLHGIGIFETMRSYHGRIFHINEHLTRLFNSAGDLDLALKQTPEEIIAAAHSLLDANQLTDARLRLTITRGNLKSPNQNGLPESTLFITAAHMVPYPPDFYRYGMSVIISDYKQNPHDPTSRHKTLNYFARLLALQQAQSKKAGEALWFTTTNHLAEACISNVFLVLEDVLLTAPLDTPVLPGITRNVVLELARTHDIPCQERPLVIKDVLAASEIFLTNSIMELMPVTHVEAHKVGTEEPGPVYHKLHDLYRQATASQP